MDPESETARAFFHVAGEIARQLSILAVPTTSPAS
jgi:hypothetical protein